jgi:hypothetical protein
MIEADNGNLYLTDFLFMPMMQRSYGLVEAVIDCVDAYNLVAAAPLLRLQLDTLVRACYVANTPSADDVVKALLEGTEFQKMKDASGQRLTDRRLVELAAPLHPWLQPVYKETSGWGALFAPSCELNMAGRWRAGERRHSAESRCRPQ